MRTDDENNALMSIVDKHINDAVITTDSDRYRCTSYEAALQMAKEAYDLAKSPPPEERLSRTKPDGYAVLLDDKASSPAGHWFVGIWLSEDAAQNVASKGKQGARVVPMFFAPPLEAAADGWIFSADLVLPPGAPVEPGARLYTFDQRGLWYYDLPSLPVSTPQGETE